MSDLTRDVIRKKKSLVNKLVIPAALSLTFVYFGTHFQGSTEQWIYVFVLLPSLAINIFLDSNRDKNINVLGATIDPANDTFDALRWCYNFVVMDAGALLVMQTNEVVSVSFWTIFTWCQIAGLGSTRQSIAATIFGLFVFWVTYRHLGFQNEVTSMALLSILACMFHAMDRVFVATVRSAVEKTEELAQTSKLNHELKKDALLGTEINYFSHELGNMIFAMDLNLNTSSPKAMDNARKVLNKMSRLVDLTLSSRRGRPVTTDISDVIFHLDIMAVPAITDNSNEYAISLTMPEEEEYKGLQFSENSGALFFVLFNLLKNARQAIERSGKDGAIDFKIVVNNEGSYSFQVSDTGGGMDAKTLESIRQGSLNKNIAHGNGLGLKFMKKVCEENQFQFNIESSSVGTVVKIDVKTGAEVRKAA